MASRVIALCLSKYAIFGFVGENMRFCNSWATTFLVYTFVFVFRNLYPYELFISGKDYSEALEKFNLKPGRKSKQLEPVIKQEPDPNNNTENVTSDYGI